MARGYFVGDEEPLPPYYSLYIILSVANTIMGSVGSCRFLWVLVGSCGALPLIWSALTPSEPIRTYKNPARNNAPPERNKHPRHPEEGQPRGL